MKRSLFARIFAGFLAVIALMSVFAALAIMTVRESNRIAAVRELYDLAKSVEPFVVDHVLRLDDASIHRYIKPLAASLMKRITIVALDGRVIADSDHDPRTMENHADRPEIIEAQLHMKGESKRRSVTLKESMLYLAVHSTQDGKPVCYIRTSMKAKTFEDAVRRAMMGVLVAAVIAVALATAFAGVVSRTLGQPLSVVSDASARVAAGDLSARAYVGNSSVYKPLADNFNGMVASLKSLIDELSARKEELATVFSAIDEAVALIDAEGIVVVANDAFRVLTERSCEGRAYWEAFPEDGFLSVVKAARTQSHVRREMRLAQRTFSVTARSLIGRGYILAVLRDITVEKDVERMKRDLVSNVSHELRTPLTSIKGYAETLADELAGDARIKYIDVIMKNTDRLANIVRDLLVLSDIERDSPSLTMDDVDIADMVRTILPLFEKRAREKGLSLHAETARVTIRGDRFKLEQLLINLIDNAVKYTEKGSIVVQTADENGAVVRVIDSGIGMPAEDIPHIFERFYVVDKSRSREAGGTGLGLSIVKHIAHLHSGSVEVKSELGKGTMFTVRLPR